MKFKKVVAVFVLAGFLILFFIVIAPQYWQTVDWVTRLTVELMRLMNLR